MLFSREDLSVYLSVSLLHFLSTTLFSSLGNSKNNDRSSVFGATNMILIFADKNNAGALENRAFRGQNAGKEDAHNTRSIVKTV